MVRQQSPKLNQRDSAAAWFVNRVLKIQTERKCNSKKVWSNENLGGSIDLNAYSSSEGELQLFLPSPSVEMEDRLESMLSCRWGSRAFLACLRPSSHCSSISREGGISSLSISTICRRSFIILYLHARGHSDWLQSDTKSHRYQDRGTASTVKQKIVLLLFVNKEPKKVKHLDVQSHNKKTRSLPHKP